MLTATTESTSHPDLPPMTRPAPRFKIPDDVWLTSGGRTARLVDLSVSGAQVLCSKVLRPHERLKLVLKHDGQTFRLAGVVVWSNLEDHDGRPRYRAGVKFTAPAPEACLAFRPAWLPPS